MLELHKESKIIKIYTYFTYLSFTDKFLKNDDLRAFWGKVGKENIKYSRKTNLENIEDRKISSLSKHY